MSKRVFYFDGVAVRSVRHTNSGLLIKSVLENSVHLGVPIDRPVDFIDKISILLITTLEDMVLINIYKEELRHLVHGEALRLCKIHKIIIIIFFFRVYTPIQPEAIRRPHSLPLKGVVYP